MTQRAEAPAIQHQFQAALLQVLRQPHSAQAQLALYQSAQTLAQTLTHPGIKTFWQVASVFLEAQALSLLPVNMQPQPLLVRLERQLQHHLQALATAQAPQAEVALLHELLITLALLDPRTAGLKQLHFSWGLPNVARRINAHTPFAQQQQALRQGMAQLAYQHLSQLVQRLNTQGGSGQRLHTLSTDAERLMAALPLPMLVDQLQPIHSSLAALETTPNAAQRQQVQIELNQVVHQLLAYRQTLSQPKSDPPSNALPNNAEPVANSAPAANSAPTAQPALAPNPLQRVLLQDARQAIKLAQQWLNTPADAEPLGALTLAFSTVSDASHALGQTALSELSNALCSTFASLQDLNLERLKTLDLDALNPAITAFTECLESIEAGTRCSIKASVLEALTAFQERVAQHAAPPWDEDAPPPPSVARPGATTAPPWDVPSSEPPAASPPVAKTQAPAEALEPAGPSIVRPQQMVRLPAQWVETYVQLAQTGRQEREQLQAQLSDLDYHLEQLEADGAALLDEFASHQGYGAISKTLMASLRSVLSLSQSLQQQSQHTQSALQQQQMLQQRLQDQIEGWQEVPLGRLEYPLQQHIQQLEAAIGRSIQLTLHDPEQTLSEDQLSTWQTPLKLLFNQAAHHGFDAAATRAELGKPQALQLSLTCATTAHDTHLTLSDDGQGIPLAPLMSRARAQGLPAQALQSTPTKLLALIFDARIATSLEQSPLPGAGPELVAAAEHVQQLGGKLELHSQVSVGTRYALRLPHAAALTQY